MSWNLKRIGALLVGASAVHAGPVAAQAPEDPPPGSPPAVVYQIPLDDARSDAAPRHAPPPGRTPTGPRDGESPAPRPRQRDAAPSTVRSENGFGSSTRVPSASAQPDGRRESAAAAPAPRPGSGEPDAAGALPSETRTLAAIAIALMLAAVGGAVAGRAARGGRRA